MSIPPRIVIVGGGWAGCAAAFAVRKAGGEAILIEKTDLLLGTGLVGGIMRNNGRFTATEEIIAMGGDDIFKIIDDMTIHWNVEFPGHRHASLYDVTRIEPEIRKALKELGVKIYLESRFVNLTMEEGLITEIILQNGESIKGDAFIDATGTAGPQSNCVKYKSGCVMCILRCPTFGPRISVAAKAGVNEISGRLAEAVSGSCKLDKKSLAPWLINKLEEDGAVVIPLPKYLYLDDFTRKKACQQYAMKEFYENIVLLDTGRAKLMAPFFPLEKLRMIPGFEYARFEDPYSGGIGNSVRYTVVTPRENTLRVEGVRNLFCAGEKVGLLVGHTEAIATGLLAGHNSVRFAVGKDMIVLPSSLAVGDIISFIKRELSKDEFPDAKYTFSGSVYFERMLEKGLYSTDVDLIHERVRKAGFKDIFSIPVV